MKKEKKVRMSISLKPEAKRKVEYFSEKLGISQAAVMSLAFEAGIKSLDMATDPTWQQYFEKRIQEGKPIDIFDKEREDKHE